MAAVTICSDFGAQENEVYHCFHCFPVDHNKLWKILKEIRLPDYLSCPLRNLYSGKKKQLEPDMKQQNGSKLGKQYLKAV